MREYLERKIEELSSDTSQVAQDSIRNYKELLELGIYRGNSTLKALKEYKKGNVIFKLVIQELHRDPFGRFMTHSIRPNTKLVDGKFVALKDIKEDELLTFKMEIND